MGNLLITEAIILAGGFGTRLQPVVSDRPKALADIAGKPFIEYQLEWLGMQGIKNVTLATHHMADQLQVFIKQWSNTNLNIDSIYEKEPLGTGGAITNVIKKKMITGRVLVINGDTLFYFSIDPVLQFMRKMKEPAMLIATALDNVSRFGSIVIEKNHVISFKQATGENGAGIVNGGAYILDSSLFSCEKNQPFSLEYELFPKLVKERKLLAYVMNDTKGFFDIGTPEAYKQICSTVIKRKSK